MNRKLRLRSAVRKFMQVKLCLDLNSGYTGISFTSFVSGSLGIKETGFVVVDWIELTDNSVMALLLG
jgi:hypothetical protein